MEPKRLILLDALRGVAALSVVVWHWQHFFALGGAWQDGWRADMQPFYAVLKPLYVQGWAAVDLFFVLSGFVFFWLYGAAIREKAVGAARFAVLRLSRLYPLHLATLLAVAVMQMVFFHAHGLFFVYQANDAPHFAAQLLMVQNWWPRAPQSFNGPGWSVSIEMLLYVLFFAACRAGLRRGLHCLALALVGGVLLVYDEHIARGVIGFFMGGFVFTLWQELKSRDDVRTIARGVGLAAAAGWIALAAMLYAGSSWLAHGEGNLPFLALFDFVLCPATVLALALAEPSMRRAPPAAFGFLGDISYAAYLLHFPMQLALALLAARLALTPALFMQGWVMLAFFVGLAGLSAAVHRWFERPLQSLLRGRAARERLA